jgi:DNA-binding transcriptional MerR regulator
VASEDASGNGAARSGTDAEWVPLKQAAAEAGVSVSTLRNWSRKGEVESQLRAGSHGKERVVRREEILAKTSSRKTPRSGPSGVSTSSDGNGAVPVERKTPSLADLMAELVDARERAARAESRAELLGKQLAEVNARFDALLLDRGIDQARTVENFDDGLPEDFPREEEDEYLPLVQRWMVRHKRRRMLKKTAREIQLPN